MDEVLEHDSAVPLYVQLEEILRAKISSGEWRPNQRIPSENELNKIYGVSRMTGRGVLTTLVNDGLLFRVQGKGTFVSPTKISTISPAYLGLREQLEAMGYETTTNLLGVGIETASAKVCAKLRLDGMSRSTPFIVSAPFRMSPSASTTPSCRLGSLRGSKTTTPSTSNCASCWRRTTTC